MRASVAGPRPERSIAEVLGRFAGLDRVRFLPWAPDECDRALLAGRALTEVAPHGVLTLAVADLAAHLDPRAAPPARAPRRRGSRATAGRRRRGDRTAEQGPGRRRAV